MAQLIVRRINEEIVAKLRERAARRGVSTEEEHRRILREAVGARPRRGSLKDHLARMPDVGDDAVFERPRAKPRRVNL